MMLNSRFELSKIEKNTRVEREICLATLENREWKENLFLPLSKIESRKRIVSCHSRKSRVEREMGTIKFSRSREKFLFLLSIFLSRARLLSMPGWDRGWFFVLGLVCWFFHLSQLWRKVFPQPGVVYAEVTFLRNPKLDRVVLCPEKQTNHDQPGDPLKVDLKVWQLVFT